MSYVFVPPYDEWNWRPTQSYANQPIYPPLYDYQDPTGQPLALSPRKNWESWPKRYRPPKIPTYNDNNDDSTTSDENVVIEKRNNLDLSAGYPYVIVPPSSPYRKPKPLSSNSIVALDDVRADWNDKPLPDPQPIYPTEPGLGHPVRYAYMVTRSILKSPAHAAGLLPFFDFILNVDGHLPQPESLLSYVESRKHQTVNITVYNSKILGTRTAYIVPSDEWSLDGSGGLLGCTLRYVEVNVAANSARKIMSVIQGGNSMRAGLVPERDWLVGMQDFGPNLSSNNLLYCTAFTHPNDSETRLKNIKPPSTLLMVYDVHENSIREVQCRIPLGLRLYPPQGDNQIPPGVELPLLAEVLTYSTPTVPLPTKTPINPHSPNNTIRYPPPLGHGMQPLQPQPHTQFQVPLPPITYTNAPPNAAMNSPINRNKKNKPKGILKINMASMILCTALTCFLCVALGVYLVVIYGITQDRKCDQPLAVWVLVHGLALFFFPFVVVYTNALLSGRLSAQDPIMMCGGWIAVAFSLFILAWFIAGNVWTFTIDNNKCDSLLYYTSFWSIIAQYVVFGVFVFYFFSSHLVSYSPEPKPPVHRSNNNQEDEFSRIP